MQALYRIVQDDFPPIPEGASPIVKTSSINVFRRTATSSYPPRRSCGTHGCFWRRSRWRTENAQRARSNARAPLSNYNFDEAVLNVQERNEALRCEYLINDEGFAGQAPNDTRLCSTIATFQTWWARPPGRFAARTARVAKQNALWRRIACVIMKLFPVSTAGRNVRPRSRASSAGGVASARRADGQLGR